MDKNDYNQLVKMYDGLKAIDKAMPKLGNVTRLSVDFACIMATRDALKVWDETDEPTQSFLETLVQALAEAQYNVAEIIMKQQEEKEKE
jgi:hypothetical protein